jgi:molybdopterin molybdotransferase
MRPGKPLMHARRGGLHAGRNPVSGLVCAHFFLLPMLRAMMGARHSAAPVSARPRRCRRRHASGIHARSCGTGKA